MGAFPRYEDMYVGITAMDSEPVGHVEMCCDQCGKSIAEGTTLNLDELIDAAVTHRTEHTSGKHG